MDNKIIIGLLTLLILSSGVVYITFMDNARIRVDEDKSTFYVPHEDYPWIWTVSGREYNSIFDGTSKMNRDVSNITIETITTNESIIIKRTTPYIRGPVIIDTYEFNPNSTDIEFFPYSHRVEVINGSGFFYRYEVRDLEYSGDTRKLTDETELSFGKNMKVTLEPDYRWAWVYKDGIVKAQYDVDSGYEVFNLRLFDPPSIGYEYLNSSGIVVPYINATVIHLWNAQDDYYFNKSSGIQFTNHFQEYWTHNIFCAGYKNALEEWIYDCNDALPFIWSINTDSENYVNITGYRDKTIGNKEVRMAIRYHLKLDDKNLSIILSIENIGGSAISSDLGFAWRVKDINIPGDFAGDKIYINDTHYWLNETLDLSFTDLGRIDFNETIGAFYEIYDDEFARLDWNDNLNYRLDVKSQSGQYNAPITLGINAGPLAIGQQKTTTLQWIDARYVAGVTIHAPLTDPEILTDGDFTMTCSWTEGGSGPPFADQEITWQYDEGTPGSYAAIPSSGGGLSTTDSTQVINNNVQTPLTITGDTADEYYVRCAHTGESVYSDAKIVTVSDPVYGFLNVSISKPINGSWYEGETNLTINATVTCKGEANAICGTVYSYPRYNLSSGSPDTSINFTEYALPFYPYRDKSFFYDYFNDSWINDTYWTNVSNFEAGESGLSIMSETDYINFTSFTDSDDCGDGESYSYISTPAMDLNDLVNFSVGIINNSYDNTATQSNVYSRIMIMMYNASSGTNPLSGWGYQAALLMWVGYDSYNDVCNRDGCYVNGTMDFTYSLDTNNLTWYNDSVEVENYSLSSIGTNVSIQILNAAVSCSATETGFIAQSFISNFTVNGEAVDLIPKSSSMSLDDSYSFSWNLTIMSADTENYLVDVLFNSSLLNENVPENDTLNREVNLNPSGEAGDPGINWSSNIGALRFLNCSPDWEWYPSYPDGQTSVISSLNATNNGTATGDFQIEYIGSLNTGWTLFACSDSSETDPDNDADCLTISDSFQTIWSDVGFESGQNKSIWLYGNCSNVSANPGVSIDMQVV